MTSQLQSYLKSLITITEDFPRKGISFKDISPVLSTPYTRNLALNEMVETYRPWNPTAIVGIEARGFLFGACLADRLHIPFVMIRKAGKLPGFVVQQSYDLEYNQDVLEINPELIGSGDRVIIHDDLLATGGTAVAAGDLVRRVGASVLNMSFIVELVPLKGREVIQDRFKCNPHALITYY